MAPVSAPPLPPPQVIIKDTSLVLTPANIKAYILMTLQGLEYMHHHWVLHRVRHTRSLFQDSQLFVVF